MRVHHIGYAVEDLDKAIGSFAALGCSVRHRQIDRDRNVEIALVENEGVVVELVSPLSAGSPVDGVLARGGAAPYHICYEVDSMSEACGQLRRDGWVVVRKPSPAPAIGGALVAFVYSKAIGLVELVESQQ
jgi:methylmalonyl-CoA/ethylmalonyl-CoA epimerase